MPGPMLPGPSRPMASSGSTMGTSENSAPADMAQQAVGDSSTSGLSWSGMLESNPYFSAGFGLMGVGVVLGALRKGLVLSATLAQRRMLVSLEISSKDPSYLWFLQWMEARAKRPAPPSAWIRKFQSHELAVETSTQNKPDGNSETAFSLVPGPGTHYFNYKSAWFQVVRERDSRLVDLTSGTPWETVKLLTLSRDRHLFPDLLDEAKALATAARTGRTVIYTAWGAEWRPFGQPRARRLLESVVLDKGVKERIAGDLKSFMQRGRWYAERGVPYRRGYLLHGPPGSGKSSFITALAGSLELDIAILNLSERGLTDDKLNHLLANAPERTLILLEDVDAAFAGRAQTDETGFRANVTFSGLLNALDGVASSTSRRILFMTTNHIDRLDPALIRPGRVDLKELLGDTTPYQAGELFHRFYKDAEGYSVEQLAELQHQLEAQIEARQQEGTPISMAALQGHFIRYDPAEALANVPEMAEQSQREAGMKRVTPSMPS